MNLILLDPGEVDGDGTVRLAGRRAAHVLGVLRPSPGDALQVGVTGSRLGTGEVLAVDPAEVVLRVTLDREPPPRAPVDVVLALPRPKILRKVLHAVASMGMGRVFLVGSYRVEKSYFASPLLRPEALREELAVGLEQGRDTVAPEVVVRRFFKPFVEDELDAACAGSARLLADPAAARTLRAIPAPARQAVVAIGPEGGWTAYESDQLRRRGFEPFSLGPRVLRVDVAVPFAVAQALMWLG